MSGADPSALLMAGALLTDADTDALGDTPFDRTLARTYGHPALGGRAVTRLCAEPLVEGDDLVMEILGFDDVQSRGAVGLSKREALGFPGWALVHRPDEARFALEVLGELRREARRSKTKPGHAMKGMTAIAKRLGQSVAAFLPSFWEEAGRAFLEVGSRKYASQCFEKARQSERVHALDVDEAHRRGSFLEFALAGAVSNKSLATYAKDLKKARSPEVAYETFHELCVKRTLGGMPPFSNMAKELGRLAKAAKLDREAQAARLVSEVIGSPALARSAPDFWKSYEAPIVAAAKADPATRGRLLDLLPTPSASSKGFDAWWLGFLERAGALEALVATDLEEIPESARPSIARAAWFDRFVAHCQRSWREPGVPPVLFGLLQRMAPALIAEGAPIWPSNRVGTGVLDLIDRALELGVPVEREGGAKHWARPLDLARWAQAAGRDEHGRDPVFVAAHREFGQMLADEFARAVGTEPFTSTARGMAGFTEAKRRWLERQLTRLTSEALPSVSASLEQLNTRSSAALFREVPGAYATLAAARVAPALAATLRAGIYAELGWPALDDAIEQLSGDVTVHGAFPYLVATDGVRAIGVAVGDLPAIEAEVRRPEHTHLVGARRVGDRILFFYRDKRYQACGVWSGSQEEFPVSQVYQIARSEGCGVAVDGGLTEGGVALRAGDASYVFSTRRIASDGVTVWALDRVPGGKPRLLELNPATGELGRASLPAWLEGDGSKGSLDLFQSSLIPVPGVQRSALGARDGLVGLAVRVSEDGLHAETPDGTSWTGPAEQAPNLAGLVRFAGAEAPTLVSTRRRRGDARGQLLDAQRHFATSTLAIDGPYSKPGPALPMRWLGAHETRDVPASEALRRVDEAGAEALLVGARLDLGAASLSGPSSQHTEAAARAALPEGADARVIAGVVAITTHAASLEAQLEERVRDRDPAAAEAQRSVPIDETQLLAALGPIQATRFYGRRDIGATMGAAARLFSREDRGPVAPKPAEGTFPFELLMGSLGAVAHLAASPVRTEGERAILVRFLRLAAQVAAAPGRLRSYIARIDGPTPAWAKDPIGASLMATAERDYLVRAAGNSRDRFYQVLEHAAPGADFAAPEGATIERERAVESTFDVAAFLTTLEARGAVPFEPAAADRLAEVTGMTRSTAALLLAGLPNFSEYKARFLDKETRAVLGLKAKDAQIARDLIRKLPASSLRAVLGALHDGGPGAWTPLGAGPSDETSPVAKMAAVWLTERGESVPIPAELLAAASRLKRAWMPAPTALAMLAAPATAKALQQMGPSPMAKPDRRAPPGFDKDAAQAVAMFVPFLFDRLPVGDPLRATLPEAARRCVERLDDEACVFEIGSRPFYGQENSEAAARAMMESMPGRDLKEDGVVVGRDDGRIIARHHRHMVQLFVRTARVVHEADFERVASLAKMARGWRTAHHLLGPLRDQARTFVARIEETPVPVGQFEANPRASTPQLVHAVGQQLALEPDGAALYLILLTLAEPTTKRVREITGWSAAKLEKTAGPLIEGELVLEAKRARAGRAYFLPGGWEALKAPDLPIENWKLPLYGVTRSPEGRLLMPLEHLVPPLPWHRMFERAWERVTSGDAPTYEETR